MATPGRDRPTLACWAVEAVGRFAGSLDLRGQPPEIGYALAPWARGRGYMTRAVRLATRWAFDEAGLPVVHWRAQAGNLGSWRVAHACGFAFQGELPLSIPHRGSLRDAWQALLRATDDGRPRTPWWPTPVLENDRVRLRPAADADVPRITAACRDPRTRHWLPELPDPYTEDDARAFLRRGPLEASLGRRVGWVVADPTDGEVGYWAHPDARGRGVVGAALDLVVAHAFAPITAGGLGRHRLQIGTAWGNTASRHVAERAGFVLVGHFHADGIVGSGAEAVLDDGAWYELLR